MRKRYLGVVTFAFLTVVPSIAADSASTRWTPPKTTWGDPDLQGTWTSDNLREVPLERPPQFGTRRILTAEELAARAKGVDEFQTEIIGKGVRPNAGYWANRTGVDAAAAPPNWQ